MKDKRLLCQEINQVEEAGYVIIVIRTFKRIDLGVQIIYLQDRRFTGVRYKKVNKTRFWSRCTKSKDNIVVGGRFMVKDKINRKRRVV